MCHPVAARKREYKRFSPSVAHPAICVCTGRPCLVCKEAMLDLATNIAKATRPICKLRITNAKSVFGELKPASGNAVCTEKGFSNAIYKTPIKMMRMPPAKLRERQPVITLGNLSLTCIRVVFSCLLAGRSVKMAIAVQESAQVVQRRKFAMTKSMPYSSGQAVIAR